MQGPVGRKPMHKVSAKVDLSLDEDYARFCRGELNNPYPLYGWLRLNDPVHWSEPAKSWILTRYRDVAAALQHDERITAERLNALIRQLPEDVQPRVDALRQHLRTFVQYYDPPQHGRLRLTARDSFTPRSMAAWRDRVQQIVDDLLNNLTSRSDIVADLAYPLPVVVIAELLGVPPLDRTRFKHWGDRIGEFFEGVGEGFPAAALAATEAVREMETYLRDLLAEKRKQPTNDLLSHLVEQCNAGRLSEAEVFGWAMFLLVAGHETTTGLIVNGLFALLSHPDQLELLRKDPGLIDSAIEELLRYDSPVQRISRVALEDFELEGQKIRRGERIWAMIGAANRDPAQFPDPDQLLVTRHPNRHIAFGYGIHFCLGAPLARLEGQVAIRTLVERFPAIRLAGEPRLRWIGVSLHRFESLSVLLN